MFGSSNSRNQINNLVTDETEFRPVGLPPKTGKVRRPKHLKVILPAQSINSEREVAFSAEQFTNTTSYDVVKRLSDIVVAALLLIAAFPVMILVALAIRLDSPGPIIFSQARMTKGGRTFTMYKFRTMVCNAEEKTGAVWATAGDPRVTKLGKFLRLTRLDELPQLVNVIRGDLSLIGPRPERPEMLNQLLVELPSFKKRLEVKAGITGLAQVGNGYADSIDSYRKKLAWDILYIRRRSLRLDFKIALKTIIVVITGHGAR